MSRRTAKDGQHGEGAKNEGKAETEGQIEDIYKRLKAIFGEILPPTGLVDASLVNELPSEAKEGRGQRIVSLANLADPVGLYLSDLLISFVETLEPSCHDATYTAYVWSEVKKPFLDLFGDNAEIAVVGGTKDALIFEDKKWPIKHPPYSKSFMLHLGRDRFMEKLFGKYAKPYVPLNPSKARAIYAEVGDELFGWKPISFRASSNVVVALAQAKAKFGKAFGGLSSGKNFFPSPSTLFSPLFAELSSSLPALEKARALYLADFVIGLKDGFKFAMNVGGRVRQVYERFSEKSRFLTREVIVEPTLFNKDWLEGIDYVKIKDKIVSDLATVVLSLPSTGKLYLSITKDSLVVEEETGELLRTVRLKKTDASDISVAYRHDNKHIEVKYSYSEWEEDIPPAAFKESYSVEFFKKDVGVVVHP